MAFSISLPAHAADIELAIHNLPATPSRLYVALFDSAESMAANKPVQSQVKPGAGNPATVVFPGLKAGFYAFNVFADENGNGQLDTNFVGMPTERYGFSNDAMGFMGPPDFDAARVRLEGEHKAISIRLR